MADLRKDLFKLLGVEPNESFGLYDYPNGNFRGNWYITEELIMMPKQHDDYSDTTISFTALLKGYFEIGEVKK